MSGTLSKFLASVKRPTDNKFRVKSLGFRALEPRISAFACSIPISDCSRMKDSDKMFSKTSTLLDKEGKVFRKVSLTPSDTAKILS